MDIDEQLSEAEQKGYDKGKRVGHDDAVATIIALLLTKAGEEFASGRDGDAQMIRQLAKSLLK